MSETDYYAQIQQAAEAASLDPLLVTCVVDQESGFDPNAESCCGALGLMQLMPSSFPGWTRAQLLDPASNLKIGCAYLSECIGIWEDEDRDEAIKFGLASYNGGSGYVVAAQELAAKAGQPTDKWAVVSLQLPNVILNGKRPDSGQMCEYVTRIWNHYQKLLGQETA